MINIINLRLVNKTDKPFVYYFTNHKLTLNPDVPVVIQGDLFSREVRQEGNTENLLVNIYNGNIELTLIHDDKFINKVEKDSIVELPQRSKVKLIEKKAAPVEVKKEEPKKVEEPKKAEEPKKEEPKKTEPAKPAEVKKEEPKKEESETLQNTEVADGKAKDKDKKVTKL
jgi:hypothetical protein